MARKTTDGIEETSAGDRKPVPSGRRLPAELRLKLRAALAETAEGGAKKNSTPKTQEEREQIAREVLARVRNLPAGSFRALTEAKEQKSQKARRGFIFLDPVTLKQVRQPIVVMETFDREDYAEQWQADFGQKLAAARVKEGISQSELARRSGLQQSHISKLEAGRMEPRVTTIFTLADTIGIRAGSLFPADPNKTHEKVNVN